MRRAMGVAVCFVAAASLAVAGCSDAPTAAADLRGRRVEILGPWSDIERARFEAVLTRFELATRANVVYTSTQGEDSATVLDRRLAEDDPPDLAMLPQPGLLRRYATDGVILPIGDVVGDVVRDHWSSEWRRLGSVGGDLYGLWFKAAHKSLVWYDVATFERLGLVPPSDPEEFAAIADAVATAGTPAFAVSGDDQWTLTDWFENLYLRLAGPDRYDALAERRIAWTDPSVLSTLTLLGRLLSPPLATGGADGIPATTFPDSVGLVFDVEPPAAAMVAEGDFVAGEITGSTSARLGVDADVFAFPDPDPSRRLVVGGGDAVVMLRSTPASRALLAYLATPAAAETWARRGGFVSPNEDVDLAVYPDDISRGVARSLIEAGDGFRFDLSDMQPPAFGATTGQGMFGILGAFVAKDIDATTAAARLEEAATAVSGPPALGAQARPRLPSLRPAPRPTPASSGSGGRSW